MNLELEHDECELLRDILNDYLVSVRREAARTEVRDMRHELVLRQELCERMIPRLHALRDASPTR